MTAEAYVAHAAVYFACCWERWLADKTLASCRRLSAASLLSDSAAREAVRCMREFGDKLCEKPLAPELISKLEEMCTCIHEREYAQANKVYMDLAIGAKKWMSAMPVQVSFSMSRQDTEVKWTPGDGQDALDESGLRKHLILLRRLLTIAQAVCPNDDPSKNSG